ncbi:hypothetical protein DPX16_8619 [Anabarilius grahami]|uniref:Uncharacterized protein n=1 Tax=Anabarilius grahami TaxID=495550 RepID=A0A3N0Z0Z2_ANAGA|nr:hypothetical protein DPX16_8619 [Anabarilius grahami]
MVTFKERCAAIIALHQNGLTFKEIAAMNIAPERTIYRISKNFKERGSTAVKKASRHPRVSTISACKFPDNSLQTVCIKAYAEEAAKLKDFNRGKNLLLGNPVRNQLALHLRYYEW